MCELNADGLPNSGRPSASFSQSRQPPLSAFVNASGGLDIVPKLEASTIEPFWKNTKSPAATGTFSVSPARMHSKPLTESVPPSASSTKSVTVHSLMKWTPLVSSHASNGLTSESYWLYLVRLTPARVSIRVNSSINRCR